MAIGPEVLRRVVSGDKLHGCLIKHISRFDIHRMPGWRRHHFQTGDRALGKSPVGGKALFPLATDQ
jgi:hypothetical protein